MPGSGRASVTASANASRLPRSAWKLSAATPSPASSRSHTSASTSAAVAYVAAFELIKRSASPAPTCSRARPAVLALAGQSQSELGQHGQVARAQAAEVAHGRHAVFGQQCRQRVGDFEAAAAARGHLREPHEHRRTHDILRQRLADTACVAAQEAQRVAREVVGDVDVAVGPDPGRAAIDRPVRRRLLGGFVAARHPCARRCRQLHRERAAARRLRQRGGRERRVTEAEHQLSSAASCRSSALVADLAHLEREPEMGGGALGRRARGGRRALRQPQHARVVAEVRVAQLGIPVEPELAHHRVLERAGEEVGQQVRARAPPPERSCASSPASTS